MPRHCCFYAHPMPPLIASFLLTSLLVELTPGPNMAWLALTSASEGRRAGLLAVAGIALGLGVVGLVSALGLAELASASPFVFALLRYAGVAYLLWLAMQAWMAADEVSPQRAAAATGAAWFRHGLTINLLNPKAALFFVAILPTFVAPGQPVAVQTLILSCAYVAIATAIHVAIVLFSAPAHGWLMDEGRVGRARKPFAILLGGIALWFLYSSGR
jgi:threonine/homoserine/homoserine lactone efflux protein